MSEDEHKKKADDVQKMTDETIKEIDAGLEAQGSTRSCRCEEATGPNADVGARNDRSLCRAMLPSSWTAMAGGLRSGDCRARPGIARASRPSRRAVRAAAELGIEYLTVYSFSAENWSRPQAEVSFLLDLLRRFIRTDVADLHKAGIRITSSVIATGLDDDTRQDDR